MHLFFFQNSSDFFFVDGLSFEVEFQFVLGASHAKDLEAIDLRDEFWRASWG
jgi:hypothetical protein